MPNEQERLQHALGLAYRYLNRRERTKTEVRRHLEQKDVEASSSEHAIDLLTEEGSVDDARFARLFVQDKRELAEWGRERIRQGLLARGIDAEVVEQALDAGPERGWEGVAEPAPDPHQAELDRALTLLGRRFPAPPHERRERDRALGLLIRKGYDPDLALDALAAYARGG